LRETVRARGNRNHLAVNFSLRNWRNNSDDSYINRWRKSGAAGLEAIVRDLLAQSVVDQFDLLARNAFLALPFSTCAMGEVSSMGAIRAYDLYDQNWALDAKLQAVTLGLPGFDDVGSSRVVAITTPGAMYALEQNANWRDILKYTEFGIQKLFNGEMGSLGGVRYVVTPKNILWNAGEIAFQTYASSPITAGDGGADWGPYTVGQAAATKYITLNAWDDDCFKVNNVVTIHAVRTSAFGSTNGVDFRDGMTFNRIIKSIDKGNKRIGFERPLFWDFATDLVPSTGVYAWVTSGRNVHATCFIFGPGAVGAGVTQNVEMHVPPVVDDLMSLHRFSWDAYVKYQTVRPEWAEVVFHAGQHRIGGVANTGGGD